MRWVGLFAAFGAFMVLAASPGAAQERHRCAAEAAKQGLKLLKFHADGDDRASVDANSVKAIGKIRALKGRGRFDVLELKGAVYKTDYRMRLLYARVPGCVLMGQELLEASDPH